MAANGRAHSDPRCSPDARVGRRHGRLRRLRYPGEMELSLSEDQIRGIVARLAQLRSAYGEAFADPDLVEPNGEYFPDEFTLDPEGVDRLLRRMLGYAPLSEDLE